jgi:hypothetical protein
MDRLPSGLADQGLTILCEPLLLLLLLLLLHVRSPRHEGGEMVEHAFGEAGTDTADMLEFARAGQGRRGSNEPIRLARRPFPGCHPGDDDLLHPLVLDLEPSGERCPGR